MVLFLRWQEPDLLGMLPIKIEWPSAVASWVAENCRMIETGQWPARVSLEAEEQLRKLDEFAEFNADALPAGMNGMPREPGPIQLEAGAVQSHNGLRLDENQCLPPPGPEPPQYHPEKPVGNGKSRMRMPPFQDSKLLPEGEILQEEIAAGTKEDDNRNRQKLHQAQHARSCTRGQSRLDNGLIVMIQQQIAILASDNHCSHSFD
jgi:hypothetical protein